MFVQVFKVFVLARVTPGALRQLLNSTQVAGANSTPDASKPGALATGKLPAATAASALGAKAPTAAKAQDVGELLPAADAAAGYQVPSDEVLAASNIYSTAEACLLAWMSHHMAKAFPQLVRPHDTNTCIYVAETLYLFAANHMLHSYICVPGWFAGCASDQLWR
jgi:hypothetical protein